MTRERAREYPKSYHPVDTCFNCIHVERLGGFHTAICLKYDLCVGIWAKCDDYDHDPRCDI